MMTNTPLVSVIIPCYNQGGFLGDAIESVLKQRYPRREIIVVDDGSNDDSSKVAANYEGVILIRQPNRGLSAARNAGVEASAGDYLVFLDADDMLLPHALQTGVSNLGAHPECAFVYGHYRLIAEGAAAMSQPQHRRIQQEHYLNMLQFNYIGMAATVMYRRGVVTALSGFDTSLAGCEDYDLYLRITRNFSIHGYAETVAEYRQHDSNMSSNFDLMLKTSLRVLGSQRKYMKGNRRADAAYRAGIKNWQGYYGKKLMGSVRLQARAGQWKRAIRGALVLIRCWPRGVVSKSCSKLIEITARAPRLFSMRLSR
jgi:glycosyltransferase involved in cell wall biosynthesis